MKPLPRSLRRLAGALAVVVAVPAHAQVSWTDWTAATGANTPGGTVTGTMMFGMTPVGVTYTGPYSFAVLGCGTDHYANNSPVYTGAGVPNRPTGCDLVALSSQATHTVTFSTAVTDPVLALVSWNNQTAVTFSGPVQVVNSGCGHFGCGSASVNPATPNVVSMDGREVHGTVRLIGTYTSFTFTENNNEFWHGFTVGSGGLATAIPEPSTYVLMGSGLLVLAGVARIRRRAA